MNSKEEILVWDPGAEFITGYKAAEALGQKITDLFNSREPRVEWAHALGQAKSQGAFRMEGWLGRKDGPPLWAEITLSTLMDRRETWTGTSVILQDATRRKNAEEAIKASLREKEVLLKEIHHRVKNNLQIISSLLRLQSETARDNETAALFLDSQERVSAMAMVHEYLYKSQDLARIHFSEYVAGLVGNLGRTFGFNSPEQTPKADVDDALLSLDVAVPCGLILTELISNAVKYAYPGSNGGPIDIRFRRLPEGFYELSVADQGVGFPKGFDWTNADSLGLRLIRLLTEQLDGQIRLDNSSGVKFTVTFKDPSSI